MVTDQPWTELVRQQMDQARSAKKNVAFGNLDPKRWIDNWANFYDKQLDFCLTEIDELKKDLAREETNAKNARLAEIVITEKCNKLLENASEEVKEDFDKPAETQLDIGFDFQVSEEEEENGESI